MKRGMNRLMAVALGVTMALGAVADLATAQSRSEGRMSFAGMRRNAQTSATPAPPVVTPPSAGGATNQPPAPTPAHGLPYRLRRQGASLTASTIASHQPPPSVADSNGDDGYRVHPRNNTISYSGGSGTSGSGAGSSSGSQGGASMSTFASLLAQEGGSIPNNSGSFSSRSSQTVTVIGLRPSGLPAAGAYVAAAAHFQNRPRVFLTNASPTGYAGFSLAPGVWTILVFETSPPHEARNTYLASTTITVADSPIPLVLIEHPSGGWRR